MAYSTLPHFIYRDFERRFKLAKTEADDVRHELHVEIFAPNRIKFYYDGDDGFIQTIHGGSMMLEKFSQGEMRKWFISVFNIWEWEPGAPIPVDGIDKGVSMIFQVLPRHANIGGHRTKLNVLLTPSGCQPPYDVRYFDPKESEYHYVDGEHNSVPLGDMDPNLLRKDFKDSL